MVTQLTYLVIVCTLGTDHYKTFFFFGGGGAKYQKNTRAGEN